MSETDRSADIDPLRETARPEPRPSGLQPETNIIELLNRRSATDPRAEVLRQGDRAWSAARLLRDSERVACTMVADGVGLGDRVAIHTCNLLETVALYLACFRIGAIALPMNARFKAEELAEWVERTRPTLYFGQQELYPRFEPVPETLLPKSARYVVDGSNEARSWAGLTTAPRDGLGPCDLEPDTPAVLLATSGTTGRSKLVVWTNRIIASLGESAEGRCINEGDIIPLTTPLMHGSGIYYVMSALMRGATTVLLTDLGGEAVLDAIERHRCTSVFGLPFLCGALAEAQRTKPRNVRSLKAAAVSGDTCSPEIEAAFQRQFKVPLLSYWAATEDVGASVRADKSGPYFGLVQSAEIHVVDDEGRPVAEGETGEMLIRSPTTAPGYWEAPGVVRPLPDGFFQSGDLVRREGKHQLRYMGRQKDLIIRAGSNISPVEVETVLRSQPGVRDVAVVGIDDVALGQRVGALLVLEPGAMAAEVNKVLEGVRSQLADYKIPEIVGLADAIPHNDLKKVDRKAVAAVISGAAPGTQH